MGIRVLANGHDELRVSPLRLRSTIASEADKLLSTERLAEELWSRWYQIDRTHS